MSSPLYSNPNVDLATRLSKAEDSVTGETRLVTAFQESFLRSSKLRTITLTLPFPICSVCVYLVSPLRTDRRFQPALPMRIRDQLPSCILELLVHTVSPDRPCHDRLRMEFVQCVRTCDSFLYRILLAYLDSTGRYRYHCPNTVCCVCTRP